MELIGEIWNGVIIRPMINSLVLLYWLIPSFGIAIIIFKFITTISFRYSIIISIKVVFCIHFILS